MRKPTQRSGGGCLTDGRRINNSCKGSETVSNEGLQTPRWVRAGLLPSTNEFFLESNYLSYRNRAVELFEKLFDEQVLELIVSQTILYVTFKTDTDFTVTVEEIHVFLEIVDSAHKGRRKVTPSSIQERNR